MSSSSALEEQVSAPSEGNGAVLAAGSTPKISTSDRPESTKARREVPGDTGGYLYDSKKCTRLIAINVVLIYWYFR